MGRMTLMGCGGGAPAVVAAYTGPGDVAGYSGAYAYWGLRAYNATQAAAQVPIIDIVDQAGSNALTVNAKTDGTMDLAAVTAWVSAHSVTKILVNKLYDQSGNGRHLVVPALPATAPELKLSMVGGLPALFFDQVNIASQWLMSATNASALVQPITTSIIARFNTFANGAETFTDGAFGFQPLVTTFTNTVSHQAGGSRRDYTGMVENSFQSFQSVINGASSSMSINGTIASNGDPGSNGISSANKLVLGSGAESGAAFMNGYIFEIAVIHSAVSTTNQALMTANQRAIGSGF